MRRADDAVLLDGPLRHRDDLFHAVLTHTALSLTRLAGDAKAATVHLQLPELLGAHEDGKRPGGFRLQRLPPLDLLVNRKERYALFDELRFACDGASEAERKAAAREWVDALTAAMRGDPFERGQVVLPRRFKVVINPTAGAADSVELVRYLRPVLLHAGIVFDASVTLMPGHAREIGRCFCPVLSEAAPPVPRIAYDAVVVVGGDDTVLELLNGMLARKDWPRAAAVPIIVLPLGRKNTIASALGFGSLATAVYSMIKGKRRPLDMMAVMRHGRRVFLPTLVSWGAINDLPPNSSPLSAWFQLARHASAYVGQVFYRAVLSPSQVAPVVTSAESAEAAARLVAPASSPGLGAVPSTDDDERFEAQLSARDAGDAEQDDEDDRRSRRGHYGPVTPALTSAANLTAAGWRSVTGNFAAVVVANANAPVNGIKATPQASPHDGLLHLFALKDPTQVQLTQALLALGAGSRPAEAPPNVLACTVDAVVIVPVHDNDKTQPPQLRRVRLPGPDDSDDDDGTPIAGFAASATAVHLLPGLLSVLHQPYVRPAVAIAQA